MPRENRLVSLVYLVCLLELGRSSALGGRAPAERSTGLLIRQHPLATVFAGLVEQARDGFASEIFAKGVELHKLLCLRKTCPSTHQEKKGPDEDRGRGGHGNEMRTVGMKMDTRSSENLYKRSEARCQGKQQPRPGNTKGSDELNM